VSDGQSLNFRDARQGRAVIPIYAPAAFLKKDARVFEVKGSEHQADATIEVRLSGLHTVRGKVLADDRHAPNVALVSLTDDTDKTFRPKRFCKRMDLSLWSRCLQGPIR